MVELRAQADALARQDPLTGLANRRALLEAIAAADGPVGLLTLDVDDFKGINTLYGHPGGDRALVFVADALRASSRAAGPAGAARRRRVRAAGAGHRRGRDGGTRAAADGRDPLRRHRAHQRRLGRRARRTRSQLLLEADEALRAAKRGGKDRALSYV